MLEILFYGFATFFETGMGIWFFGKMFPKRERMEKRHYAAEWGLYSILMVTTYTFPAFFLGWKEKNTLYISVLCSIYIVLILINFVIRYLDRKRGKNGGENIVKTWLLVGMIVSLTCQNWAFYISDIQMLWGNVFPVFFLYAFYECSFAQSYLWNFFYMVSMGLIKFIYITFRGAFQENYFSAYVRYPRRHTWEEIIFWIIGCGIVYFLLKFSLVKTVMKRLLVSYKVFFGGTVLICWNIICVLMNHGVGKIQKDNLVFTLIFCMIVIIVFILFFFRFYGQLVQTEKRLLDVRNSVIEVQYQELSASYERYRRLVHDEKHMISYLTECLLNGESEKAIYFLREYQGTLTKQSGKFCTGIQCLDFILNVMYRKMMVENIKFTYDLDVSDIPMKESDFIIVMSNLLENAIEAAKKCRKGERDINMRIKNANQFFILEIDNTCIKKAVVKKDKFITDKEDRHKHGVGVESVKQIIKQYDGDIMFSYYDSKFEVDIMISKEGERTSDLPSNQSFWNI